jgi:hypothetical protein
MHANSATLLVGIIVSFASMLILFISFYVSYWSSDHVYVIFPVIEGYATRALQRDVVVYIWAWICCLQLVSDQ